MQKSLLNLRNTSTDVEKTVGESAPNGHDLKHLHGRGEDVEAVGPDF